MSIADLPTSDDFQGHSSPAERRPPHRESLDDLDALNFYCFEGRRDLSREFRALVVGDGGQSAIDLAGQMRDTAARVVYLEPHEESLGTARQQAEAHGLHDAIEWTQGSPLELSRLGLEPFDYINCGTLLDRSDDPLAALKRLKSALKPKGALGVSLAGRYGRTGLAQLRQLLQLVNRDTADAGGQAALTRAVIDRLPATNWCKRGVDLFPLYDGLSDADLHELFLDARPRDYSLPEIWDLLEAAGLVLVEHTREHRPLYEPQFAFPEGPLLREIQKLPRRDQQAATELYWGAVTRHTFWASTSIGTTASLLDPEMIPFFTRLAVEQNIQQSILATAGDEWSWSTRVAGEVDVAVTFHVAPAARRFVELIDNRRTLAEIVETILSAYNPRPPVEEAWKIARYVMEVLLRQDLLLVRHQSTPPLSAAA